MSIQPEPFGTTPDGAPVERFTLRSPAGRLTARITNYGGHVTEIHTPDRDGRSGNIVTGFDRLDGYLGNHPYFGSTVGRVANRIANGRFTLDGMTYQLPINNGANTLHGGTTGLHRVLWSAQAGSGRDPSLELRHTSPDGQDGFPGNLKLAVVFTLTDTDLRIDYTATTDKPTPINVTNHSYFNLRGPGSGDVKGHVLMIDGSHYIPVNEALIPTGQIAPVQGTAFDFTTPTPIGERLGQVPGGYDHNYVLDTKGDLSRLAARAHDPKTGRAVEVYTTEPGVQFYSGNFLDGSVAGIGGTYHKHGAFCLETQHFPDSVNQPGFPNTILKPGETFRSTTIYRFTTDAD